MIGCWSTYVLFGAPSMHFLLDKHSPFLAVVNAANCFYDLVNVVVGFGIKPIHIWHQSLHLIDFLERHREAFVLIFIFAVIIIVVIIILSAEDFFEDFFSGFVFFLLVIRFLFERFILTAG